MDELSIQELSDEDLNRLIELGVIPEEQAQLAKQIQQAQMLQQQQGPQGRQTGGIYTAANPLEFVGAGLQQYAGIRKERQAQEKLDELRKQQIMGRQLYAQRALDTPFRRESQPFIQKPTEEQLSMQMPAMSF